ncbi:MAG: RNA polymerase sigma factor [Candidatus Limnocylindrales bacterium]
MLRDAVLRDAMLRDAMGDYARASRVMDGLMLAHLRRSHDGADFVSDALVSLATQPGVSYHGMNTLICIARRKMIDAARRPRAAPFPAGLDRPDGAPSVESELEGAEALDNLLSKAATTVQRRAVCLLSEGYDTAEIASEIGVGRRQLQRFLRQFKLQHEPF